MVGQQQGSRWSRCTWITSRCRPSGFPDTAAMAAVQAQQLVHPSAEDLNAVLAGESHLVPRLVDVHRPGVHCVIGLRGIPP